MSYIINNNSPFVSIKLTSIGRQKLASGQLNFSFFGLGDSEINYNREEIVDANQSNAVLSGSSRIFRPFDNQPDIKSFITKVNSDSLNPINTSDINVLKVIVNNQAKERGFFTGTSLNNYQTITGSTIIAHTEYIQNTNFAGGNVLNGFASTASFNVGDLMLVKLTNDTVTGQTINSNIIPIPNLWYKIQSLSANSITVDRELPNISNQTTSQSQIYIYRGGEVYDTIATGTTTAYWDTGTLSFDAASNVTCHDVPVWNMNNVWCENIAGITGLSTTNLYENYTKFGSYAFLGTKNPYLENLCSSTDDEDQRTACERTGASVLDPISKSMSIIHFTNNSISNLYGEFLFVDTTNNKTVNVIMPDLMYHRRNYSTGSGSTMGMKFISSGATKLIGVSDIEYIDLIEDITLLPSGTTPLIVGKVFPQLKLITITNDEIVAAISYKSNRNWTLPALSATLSSPTTGTGVLQPTDTMYLTYALENGTGTGLTTSLLCQQYVKISNNSPSAKNIEFMLEGVDLLPYMRKIEGAGYDGRGFHAYKFKLVYQIVSNFNDRPDPGAWKTYDFTSTAITQTVGATINPKLLEIQTPATNGFILTDTINLAATQYDITQSLSIAPNSDSTILQFGDERLYYGNIQSYIGATIYKTIFDIRINSGQYSVTSNPTRSKDLSTNPPNIKVSEVGIYDSDKNLVIIGKLSTPVALLPNATIMLELSLDF